MLERIEIIKDVTMRICTDKSASNVSIQLINNVLLSA